MSKVKSQKAKVKTTIQNLKFYLLTFSFAFYLLTFTFNSYAKEITILYTGDTHAMLYPCNCPLEADGGLARRATLIKKLRRNNPNLLLFDAGRFFAGGAMDNYTQNSPLDMRRSEINLKAMELMRYDALNIGEDEFNFGSDFLKESIAKTKLSFLSANAALEGLLPYLVKEVAGVRIGIIGLTNTSSRQKAAGVKFIEAKVAVGRALAELKAKNVQMVILLSNQDDNEDLDLLREIKGIDILITANSRTKDLQNKFGDTLILRPSWQGRRLSKLWLKLSAANKITDYKLEDLRLSDKISDAQEVSGILPGCFSDINCQQNNQRGTCQQPGQLDSRCDYPQTPKVSLQVLTSRQCKVCQTKNTIDYLKAQFPLLDISYLYYPAGRTRQMVKDLGISTLPAYILGKQVEQEKKFSHFKEKLESKDGFYLLKPQFGGIGYFLNRKREKGRLDLFIRLYDEHTAALLELTRDYQPQVHFLATCQEERTFDAIRGKVEVEEYLRAVCVQKYYPEYFWDYILCRAKDIESSWWDNCLTDYNTERIKNCAQSEQGRSLLRGNLELNKELRIMFGPTYLVDNQEIFSTHGAPAKRELDRAIKKR